MYEQEPTCKMDLDELLRLVDTTKGAERQRITSEMPSVTLDQLLQPADDDAAIGDDVAVIHDRVPPASEPTHGVAARGERRFAVVVISFAVTLLAGIASGMFLL